MLNHINIMGRIVATPELRKTKNDTAVASFRIACDRDYTEGTDFFDCVAWRKTGEFVTKYFKKVPRSASQAVFRPVTGKTKTATNAEPTKSSLRTRTSQAAKRKRARRNLPLSKNSPAMTANCRSKP